MSKYLITYATNTGTTKDIAEKIADRITQQGIIIDIKPSNQAENLGDYTGIILGAPINGMKLIQPLKDYIQTHQELIGKTLALFAVAYVYQNGRPFWRKLMDKDIAQTRTQLKTTITTVFGGKIDKRMPGFINFLFGTPKDLPLDIRNWEKIDQWADQLIQKIKQT